MFRLVCSPKKLQETKQRWVPVPASPVLYAETDGIILSGLKEDKERLDVCMKASVCTQPPTATAPPPRPDYSSRILTADCARGKVPRPLKTSWGQDVRGKHEARNAGALMVKRVPGHG